VSEFLRLAIDTYARGRIDIAVLPNVVDDVVFSPAPRERDPHELLYVGAIRGVKRIDVLLQALAEARQSLPKLHLRILSANAFRAYDTDYRKMRELVSSLGLDSVVSLENGADPPAVAEAMRRCAFVVVSSKRETFCSVAAESLACGTPLVITRCGGPEEFVSPADGIMVEPDDPAAFADSGVPRLSPQTAKDRVLLVSLKPNQLRRKFIISAGLRAGKLQSQRENQY